VDCPDCSRDIVVSLGGHTEEDANDRDRPNDGIGFGCRFGRAVDATIVVVYGGGGGGRDVGWIESDRCWTGAGATSIVGADARTTTSTAESPRVNIATTTTTIITQCSIPRIVVQTAVDDNHDETTVRGAGDTRFLQGGDDELGQGTDRVQHQLHGVRYHTGPHRIGGRGDEEEGQTIGEGEHIETIND
jgi:hypothetical protein